MDVYLETAPVIYLVENVAPWEPVVRDFLAEEGMRPRVSILTRMECRVQPLRNDDLALLADYDEFSPASQEACCRSTRGYLKRPPNSAPD